MSLEPPETGPVESGGTGRKAAMSRTARFYILTVQLAGFLLLSYSVLTSLQVVDLRWLYLLLLTALASFVSVKVSSSDARAGSVLVSAGDFFIFAAIVLAGPPAGALMGAVEGLVSSWRVHVTSPRKLLFNISQLTLAGYLAGALYASLLPEGALESSNWGPLVRLFPILVCALAYFALNSLLVAVAMALASRQPLPQIIEKGFLWGLPSNCINACLVVIVLTLAGPIDVWLALALLPLILVAYALRRFHERISAAGATVDSIDRSPFGEALTGKVRGVLLTVALFSLPLYAYCLYHALTMARLDWLYLAGLAAVTAVFPLRLFSVRNRRWLTLSDVLVFVGIFQFGPEVAALIASIEAIAVNLRRSANRLSDWVFQLAKPVLIAFLVGQLFDILEFTADLTNLSELGVSNLVTALMAPMICGFLYYLLILGLTTAVASITSRQSFLVLWRDQLGWTTPSVLGVLVGALGYLLSGGFLWLR